MDQVFSEIVGTPGVLGVFVFCPPDRVLANTLASRFDGPSLINTGKLLQKIHSTTRMNIADLSEVLLFYDEALLIVREVSEKVYLVVMCEGSSNPYLVTMSVTVILEDLRAWVQRQQTAHPLNEVAERPSPVAQKSTPEDLMEGGPLADTLSEMQAVLARVMGPMASIIFVEAKSQWVTGHIPSEATLNELVKILAKEIKDPERIKRFRDLVSPYLRARK